MRAENIFYFYFVCAVQFLCMTKQKKERTQVKKIEEKKRKALNVTEINFHSH